MDLAKGKAADIAQRCIYKIATGKWPPGTKLPSVRKAEKLWAVNRLTVLSAYQELEKTGLVVSKDRSGYYVSGIQSGLTEGPHWQKLYDEVEQLIRKHTDTDLEYIFRLFGSIAADKAKADPVYAFLECSEQQAGDHANEIYQRFGMYIKPVCLPEDNEPDLPKSVTTLLTTGFHIKEVMTLGQLTGRKVANVPIEIDPKSLDAVLKKWKKAIVVEQEGAMSSSITQDIRAMEYKAQIQQVLLRTDGPRLEEVPYLHPEAIILLSPRVWGMASHQLRKHERVKLIRFCISDASWQDVAQVLKIQPQGA